MSVRPNSGQYVFTKCSWVSSLACVSGVSLITDTADIERTCHIMKSLRRLTFEVRTSMSSLPRAGSTEPLVLATL